MASPTISDTKIHFPFNKTSTEAYACIYSKENVLIHGFTLDNM